MILYASESGVHCEAQGISGEIQDSRTKEKQC